MKNYLILILLAVFLIAGVSAEPDAEIQPQSPETIVLDADNSYEYERTFDATLSEGDDLSYEWNANGEENTGPTVTYIFDRSWDSTTDIFLTVIDENGDEDFDSVTQRVRDVPEITEMDADTYEVEGEGEVNFTVNVENEFDGDVEYEWMVDGDAEDTGENLDEFSYDFDGTYQGEDVDIDVNVTDQADLYSSESVEVTVLEDPEFDVDITSTNSPVDEGDTLGVNVDVTNIGEYEGGSQNIDFTVEDNDGDFVETEETNVGALEPGETEELSFSWSTSEGDNGFYDVTVEAVGDGNTDSESVEVEEQKEEEQEEEEENGGEDNLGGEEDDGDNGDEENGETDEDDFDEEVLLDVDKGEAQDLEFGDSPISSLSVTASDGQALVGNIRSTVTEDRPDSASEDPFNNAYRYIEFDTDTDSGSIDNVDFTFEVGKDWIEDESIANETVSLERYGNSWEALETDMDDEDEDNFYYSASREGFSTYAITGEEAYSDLTVIELSVDRDQVQLGAPFEVTLHVVNRGNREGTEDVAIQIGDSTLNERFSLEPGESSSETIEASLNNTGVNSVSARDIGTTVEVLEDEGSSPLLLLMVFISMIVAIGTVVIVYTGKEKKVEELINSIKGSDDKENEKEFEWNEFNQG